MNEDSTFEVIRVTSGPKHHLFGFHDLVQSNARGDLLLGLEVADISRPPLPGEKCAAGVIADGSFKRVLDTNTWNYPQGARQQWIGDSDLFTCNLRDECGRVVASVNDGRKCEQLYTLPFPIHCQNAGKAFFINYDRLHAVGAYGYVPSKYLAIPVRIDDVPSNDGLWIGDMSSGKKDLLISVKEIASVGEIRPVHTGFPHYVTHPMLNPTGDRIAFLHRYRLRDGGETTRLMTVGIDGRGLRCLGKGFLSHFTWISNDEIFIWGADQPRVYAMRESRIWNLPFMVYLAKIAKSTIKLGRRFHLRKNQIEDRGGHSKIQSMSFLRVRDGDEFAIEESAVGVLTEDGHPMASPRNLNLLVNDTYPDEDGTRTLMLYDVKANRRINIGKFKMLNEYPDNTKFDSRAVQSGTDVRIKAKFDKGIYMFTRSGLHCDLHPRWSYSGDRIYFDSIHEGSRQIYSVEVSQIYGTI